MTGDTVRDVDVAAQDTFELARCICEYKGAGPWTQALAQQRPPRPEPATASSTFYLVWTPDNTRSPRYRHERRGTAESEADRLANENAGSDFYVLAAVSRRRLPPLERQQLVTEADLPELAFGDDFPF